MARILACGYLTLECKSVADAIARAMAMRCSASAGACEVEGDAIKVLVVVTRFEGAEAIADAVVNGEARWELIGADPVAWATLEAQNEVLQRAGFALH